MMLSLFSSYTTVPAKKEQAIVKQENDEFFFVINEELTANLTAIFLKENKF